MILCPQYYAISGFWKGYVHVHGHKDPDNERSKPQSVQSTSATSGPSPGGDASIAGFEPIGAVMPGRICAMSSRCAQITGLFSDFVIKSATCCFAFTYLMRTLGFEQTSNNQCTSIRWVRGRCRSAMLRAFLMILITASLSSAMTRHVVCSGRLVYAKYFPVLKSSE